MANQSSISFVIALAWVCAFGAHWEVVAHGAAPSRYQSPEVKNIPKVLNNFVIELLNLKPGLFKGYREYKFYNPRQGWTFFSSTVEVKGSDKVWLCLDSAPKEEAVIVHKREAESTQEAMRFLSAGEHKIKIRCEGKPRLRNIIVRAVPELIYCQFQANPHVSEYGPYDWNFLRRYVLRNVNTIIGYADKSHKPFVEQWKKAGKKWLIGCGVPGLAAGSQVTTEEAYEYWSGSMGFQEPLMDGVIADEFWAGLGDKFQIWTEAIKRIHENIKFRGKAFYAWCGNLYEDEKSKRFAQALINWGDKIVWERYLKEQPTETEARKFLDTTLRQEMSEWRKALPGCERNMIVCFGYLSQPPESLNTNPSVNWKVYMDMQMNLVATDPVFRDLYGVMWYLSSYADEESVRWASRLYRHYCLEGKTEMLSKDPYRLNHIENPDFDEGTKGWTLSPAEEGTIAVKNVPGYSWLQGRYPKTNEGNNFLWTKRSSKKPNAFWQEIKNLKPGRLYSLKMFTGDYKDLTEGKSVKQKHAVSIKLENVELIAEKCFQHIFANCYSHHLGPYNDKHKAWMNFHWRVFRPKANKARLVVSDWTSETEPGGPIGQETMFNFIEIQPYLED